jgi:uncharacterized membrane protein YcfT
MDTLRGAAIILMICWHATSMPALLHGVDVPAGLTAVNDALLPYRMPCLMFLSGLLLPRSVSKPLGQYYRGKIALIAYPYVLWVIVYCLVIGADHPYWDPRLYVAKGYLWYLFYIGVFYLVAPLLRRFPPYLPPVVFLLAGTVVQERTPHRMLFFAVFFFAGSWAAQRIDDVPGMLRKPWLLVALAVPAVGFAVVSATHDVNYQPLLAPFSFAGIGVAIVAAAALSSRHTTPLRYVGRNSIVYYCAHFPAMVGVLAVLVAVDAPWWVMIPALVAVGLGVGTVASALRGRPPVRWLFEAPFLTPTRKATTREATTRTSATGEAAGREPAPAVVRG